MSLIKGYRENVWTITVTDQTFGHRRFVPSALQTGQKALKMGVLIQFLAQQMGKNGV
jgi:hypothetical protein